MKIIFSVLIFFLFGFFALANQANAQIPEYTVKVVYFYPSDYTPDPKVIAMIDPYVAEVQNWYKNKLGFNRTFYASPIELRRGLKPASGYTNNIFSSIWDELGISCGTKTTWLIFVADSIWVNGGAGCGPTDYAGGAYNGVAMVGEAFMYPELIATKTGYCPNGYPLGDWRCSITGSKGDIAHELGHAFSLPHPITCDGINNSSYCYQSVMYAWWDWPNVGLLDLQVAPEKQTLSSSQWFSYNMPTPTNNPSTCSQYSQYCDQNGSCNWSSVIGTSLCATTVTGYYRGCLGATGDLTSTVNAICGFTSPTNTPTPTRTPPPTSTPTLTPTPTIIPGKTGDINGDGQVGILDLSILLSNWGSSNPSDPDADINKDGTVGIIDLSTLLSNWGI